MKKLSLSERHFILYIAGILLILTSPFWLWLLKPSHSLNIVMMDKTVPNASYREHKGLTWILNNQKLVKEDGSTYAASKDYEGYHPVNKTSTGLSSASLQKADVIYITDQYGVYKKQGKNGRDGAEVTGGLNDSDISRIENSLLSNKKTLIAEFNTFASPTKEKAQEHISNLLNITWTGWSGRYFEDMSNKEVPEWLKQNYQKQNHNRWSFTGKGFVFVNQEGFVIAVPAEKNSNGASFGLTVKGRDIFDGKLHSSYQYWFDVIQPRDKSEVMADYSLPLSKKAKSELKGYGIPSEFPAVIYHQNASYTSYYFAGDYADESEVPQIYQTVGFNTWKRYVGERKSFYWTVYVPLMDEILNHGLKKTVPPEKIAVQKKNGMIINSRTGAQYIQVLQKGKWKNLLIKGVNMGIAKPGAFPGETAISKEEYLRWFQYIGSMNANAIRVYTLHSPAFYEAFYEYNKTAKKPLYLFHGIWADEGELTANQNVYQKNETDEFKGDIRQVVDVLHGNTHIPKKAGHASGTYRYDISRYVLGYIIGIEWDPEAVKSTNEKNAGMKDYSGEYFQTKNGNPFEIWLARMMDYTGDYEASRYHWQHNMSFTNWVTTDLLHHPAEPSQTEDMVSINPNHITAKKTWKAGLFASYHIYPYYPDFLNYEKKYLNFKDQTGRKNNYEGYLHDLIKVHHLPVLVAEFGVPGSRGMTHVNPYGMNQGKHSEEEQGEIDAALYRSIVNEKYAGGMVFSWQDEWFKRTWNNMDYDDPNRRPYWSNVQTNEQHFGLLSFDPGKTGIYPDGNTDDWKLKQIQPFYQNKNQSGILKRMYITSDEAYLQIRLDYNNPINWKHDQQYLLFDTVNGQGEKTIKLNPHLQMTNSFGTDFLVELNGLGKSRILVDSYYDPFYYQYAKQLKMIPEVPNASKPNNGVFDPIRLALNKTQTIPTTGKILPFQSYETGKLLFGNGNPDSKNYNSLTDISISKDKKTIELRIPWQLLNMKDPSQKEALGNIWKKGLSSSRKIQGIKAAAIAVEDGKLRSSLPALSKGKIPAESLHSYNWEPWEEPLYTERLKESYEVMKKTYEMYGR